MFQYRFNSLQVKRELISTMKKFVYELPQELPSDVKLRILGDQEILGKSQNWVMTQLSAQSLLQNWSFGNSGQ